MATRRFQNMRLEEACDRYLTRITNEGQAKASLVTAHYALRRLRRSLATRREPNPWLHLVTAEMMDDYCFGPTGIRRGIGADSFNRYRSVLNGLFEYGIAMRWCDTNPMQAIGRARPDAPKQRLLLTAGELLALPDLCTTPIQRIACAIGMNTGLRANDIRHLRLFDVSLSGGVIQTEIRKVRKLDVKPITLDLAAELKRWLETYSELTGTPREDMPDEDWLLVPSYRVGGPGRGHLGAAYSSITLYPTKPLSHMHLMVQKPLAKLGYPTKGEGVHTLRRSSARVMFEMLREQGDGRDHALMVVRDYLNHASVVQTEHYLGLSHERAIRDALLRDKPFLSRAAESEQERVSGERVRRISG